MYNTVSIIIHDFGDYIVFEITDDTETINENINCCGRAYNMIMI